MKRIPVKPAIPSAASTSSAATFLLLKLIGAVMPLRGEDRDEALGMDLIHHGEEAYATGEGAILVTPAELEEKVPVADPA